MVSGYNQQHDSSEECLSCLREVWVGIYSNFLMIDQLNLIISLARTFTKMHIEFTVKSTQMEYYNQDLFNLMGLFEFYFCQLVFLFLVWIPGCFFSPSKTNQRNKTKQNALLLSTKVLPLSSVSVIWCSTGQHYNSFWKDNLEWIET